MVGIGVVVAGAVMTGVAANLESAPVLLGTKPGRQVAVAKRTRQHSPAVIRPMAWSALGCPAALNCAVMVVGPLLAYWMHTVRSAPSGIGLRIVTTDTIGNSAFMSLNLQTLDVVVFVQRWKLRMCRVVAGFTSKPAMTSGEAV